MNKNTLLITGKASGGRTTLAVKLVYDKFKELPDIKVLFITESSEISIINKFLYLNKSDDLGIFSKEVRKNLDIVEELPNNVLKYDLIVIDSNKVKEIYNDITEKEYLGEVILVTEDTLTEDTDETVKRKIDELLLVQHSIMLEEGVYLMTVEHLNLSTLNVQRKEYKLVHKIN